VVVVFNPHSTGDAPALAEELRADLAERLPDLPVRLEPTQYAGHARVLAGEVAGTGRPLVVSVSGDGGYNEVVDGVVKAGNDHAVCAVKAAGNANDHRRATRERPLVEAIVAGEVRRIDLLRLTIGEGADARVQYAHSYIGMGLTPVVAIDLEKGGKGSFREILSVVRTFAAFRPFTIRLEDGRRRSFDSLLFANIAEMAKYATSARPAGPTTGSSRSSRCPTPRSGGCSPRPCGRRSAVSDRSRRPGTTRSPRSSRSRCRSTASCSLWSRERPCASTSPPRRWPP
jgi:diacylglycerol kinase family enzyme